MSIVFVSGKLQLRSRSRHPSPMLRLRLLQRRACDAQCRPKGAVIPVLHGTDGYKRKTWCRCGEVTVLRKAVWHKGTSCQSGINSTFREETFLYVPSYLHMHDLLQGARLGLPVMETIAQWTTNARYPTDLFRSSPRQKHQWILYSKSIRSICKGMAMKECL